MEAGRLLVTRILMALPIAQPEGEAEVMGAEDRLFQGADAATNSTPPPRCTASST